MSDSATIIWCDEVSDGADSVDWAALNTRLKMMGLKFVCLPSREDEEYVEIQKVEVPRALHS